MFGISTTRFQEGSLNAIEYIKFAGKCIAWPYLLYEKFNDENKILNQYSSANKYEIHTKNINYQEVNTEFESIPKSCSQYSNDVNLYSICELARNQNVRMDKASLAFFIAGGKSTADICNFKLTDDFNNKLNQVLKDADTYKVYSLIMNNVTRNFPNVREYCQEQYLMFKNRLYK